MNTAPELVLVYEKLRPNIWTFNGVFRLVDEWRETSDGRKSSSSSSNFLTIRTPRTVRRLRISSTTA